MNEVFSLSEAAAIAELSPDTLRTAVEKKSVIPSCRRRAGRAMRHGFSEKDVMFIKVLSEFPFPLSKPDKQSLAQMLTGGKRQAGPWSQRGTDLVYGTGQMRLTIDCKPIRQKVKENLAAFRWGRRRVVSSAEVLGGEPVFRGTRIPVHHVASLFRKGVSEREIAEDFPALSDRELAYARLLARIGAKPGRPKQRLTHGARDEGRLSYAPVVGRDISRPPWCAGWPNVASTLSRSPMSGYAGRPIAKYGDTRWTMISLS